MPYLFRFSIRFAPFIAVLLFVTLPARAALFDDEEARRRADAVRLRVEQLERSLSQRLDALEATVKSQALADMLNEIQQIRSDIAKLNGQYEVLAYELEQAQKRQRDLYVDLDNRVRKLEIPPAPPASAAPPANPETSATTPPTASSGASPPPVALAAGRVTASDVGAEQKSYDAALDQFKSGDYVAAIVSFQNFAKTYPKSALAPSALYWAGNAQYAQKDFRAAIATQRQLLSAYPDSQKVPDALLNIASSQGELGDAAGSRRTLQEIIAKHPSSEAAAKARQRLAGR